MALLKSEIRNKYTVVPNSIIRAKDISDGDYRLLMYLYSLPNGWKVNQNYLGTELNCSRININKKIRRIKEAGYLEIKKSDNDDTDYIYILKEKEIDDGVSSRDVSPSDVSSRDVSPRDVSPSDTYINKDIINTNIINNDINISTTTPTNNPYDNPYEDISYRDISYRENNNKESIFELIENNFGRTLNAIELEVINKWEDTELTRYAIKKAILQRVFNIKYIDKILYEYKKENITTVADAEYNDKLFQERKKQKTTRYKTPSELSNEVLEREREKLRREKEKEKEKEGENKV